MSRRLRVLVVHPGATTSTHDVYEGLMEGLASQPVEVQDWALDERIEAAGGYLTYLHKRLQGRGITSHAPTPGQILYRAGAELVERALRWQPDWLVVVSAMYLHPDVMVLLRRAGLKVALVLTESPYDATSEMRLIPWAHLVTTNEITCVSRYRHAAKRGDDCPAELRGTQAPEVIYLPWAQSPTRHNPSASQAPAKMSDGSDVPSHDVVFVGTGFQERIDLLSAVRWSGIDLGLYGNWQLLHGRSVLRRYVRGAEVLSNVTHALYRKAKVGLNPHRLSVGFGVDAPRIASASSANLRCYELAAAGLPFVTDARDEVVQLFGDAVPTYRDAAELERVVRGLLGESARDRANRCRRLQAAVHAHTWQARAQTLVMALTRVGAGSVTRSSSMLQSVGG